MVDDDESFLKLYSSMLKNEGYLVESSKTGEQALSRMKSSTYHLIILDYLLPDIQGDKVIKKIRENDRDTRIILVTGHPSYSKCIDVLGMGISDILIKPVSLYDLCNSINEALRSPIYYNNSLGSWIPSKSWIT